MTGKNHFDVTGKAVLITGAATGIGLALARGFWEAGAAVIPVTRRESVDWGDFPEGQKGRWRPLVCDLADPAAVAALSERAIEAGDGRMDVFVHAAAFNPPAPGDPYDASLRREIAAAAFEAPYALCGRLAPWMANASGGSIIHVTSINAELAWPGNPAYVTAKAALRLLTKCVARDFGARGVRANNLCPGYVHTRMTAASYMDPAKNEERRSRTMLGRWGEPGDMVGPALFLASDASRYVTGIDLHVDGGWSAMGL